MDDKPTNISDIFNPGNSLTSKPPPTPQSPPANQPPTTSYSSPPSPAMTAKPKNVSLDIPPTPINVGSTEKKSSTSGFSLKIPLKLSPTVIATMVILLFLIAGGAYLKFSNKLDGTFNTNQAAANPQEALKFNQSEDKDLVTKVNKIFNLPSGEVPKIGSVSNVQSLKNDPFFKNAQDGDKVLVFEGAKRAVLYRPSENRVIEVGKVDSGQTTPSGQIAGVSSSSSPPAAGQIDLQLEVKHAFYLEKEANNLVDKLKLIYPQLSYQLTQTEELPPVKSKIIDKKETDKSKEAAKLISDKLSLDLGLAGESESTSSADIILIVGLDQ